MILVYATDRRYVTPTRFSIASAITHSPGVRDVVVLGSGLRVRDIARLESVPQRVGSGARVRVIEPTVSDLAPLGGLATTERYPLTVYFKLLAPTLLADADDLIWLDGDTLVRTDLGAMPALAPGHAFAAVRDWYLPDFARRRGQLPQPVRGWDGVSDATPMFNAGVMRIDARAWREQSLTARVVARLKCAEQWMPLPEQDAMAAECAGVWTELPPVWNVQSNARSYHAMRGRDASTWLGIDVEESMRTARVVHWSGHRPWQNGLSDPLLKPPVREMLELERRLEPASIALACRRCARGVRGSIDRAKGLIHRWQSKTRRDLSSSVSKGVPCEARPARPEGA